MAAAFERKITSAITAWLEDDSETRALLIKGARRVGKTFVVENLGECLGGRMLVKLDFQTDSALVDAIFSGPTNDTERIVRLISEYLGLRLEPATALLFFDEVQLNERALNSLRFFEQSPWHVIATGSLLGVTVKQRHLPFPSGVRQIEMHPMDFEEFLWALGEHAMAAAVREHFQSGEPYILHERALELYRRFLVVGGMPGVVRSYVESHSFATTASRQREIDETYVADMTDPDNGINGAAAKRIWESVTSQLLRASTKKFKYSEVERGGRRERLLEPLEWLEAAGVVTKNDLTRDMRAPLTPYGDEEGTYFKLYMADTGIMFHKFGIAAQVYLDPKTQALLSSDFRGALAENYVMQALRANGLRTFYWMPATNAARGELDFVLQTPLAQVIPIEVKSGRNVAARSLKRFIAEAGSPCALRLSEQQFGATPIEDANCTLRSVPLYAAFCIDNAGF